MSYVIQVTNNFVCFNINLLNILAFKFSGLTDKVVLENTSRHLPPCNAFEKRCDSIDKRLFTIQF